MWNVFFLDVNKNSNQNGSQAAKTTVSVFVDAEILKQFYYFLLSFLANKYIEPFEMHDSIAKKPQSFQLEKFTRKRS